MTTTATNRIKKAEANGAAKGDSLPIPETIGDMKQIAIRFIGITPLIQHSTRGMDLGEPGEEESIKSGKRKNLKREDVAEQGSYPTGDGKFFHPAEAFRSAAIDAVTGMKIGKGSAPALFMQNFFTVTEQAILIDPKTRKPLAKYEIDERVARNPSTGGAVLAIRPKWAEWACEVVFEYDPTQLNETIILGAMNLAGQRVGIGILRPLPSKKNPKRGKGGRYGKFRAEKA